MTLHDLANCRISSIDFSLGDLLDCRFIDGEIKVVESFVIGKCLYVYLAIQFILTFIKRTLFRF